MIRHNHGKKILGGLIWFAQEECLQKIFYLYIYLMKPGFWAHTTVNKWLNKSKCRNRRNDSVKALGQETNIELYILPKNVVCGYRTHGHAIKCHALKHWAETALTIIYKYLLFECSKYYNWDTYFINLQRWLP